MLCPATMTPPIPDIPPLYLYAVAQAPTQYATL